MSGIVAGKLRDGGRLAPPRLQDREQQAEIEKQEHPEQGAYKIYPLMMLLVIMASPLILLLRTPRRPSAPATAAAE